MGCVSLIFREKLSLCCAEIFRANIIKMIAAIIFLFIRMGLGCFDLSNI